ncbi:MAG: Holliday junction resolvase RuvX [Syntrophales bacterium]|nr:Holliday junction resolvase RuvX [Syntrophales bacterium]MDY0043066.1 Holliday junction resolvase RuvX [Syntrophales bacterium]
MGLDYGSRRIGVALSDELQITAQALRTVVRKNLKEDLDEIAAVAKEYKVKKIVIGYPVRLNGSEGPECQRVSDFADRLESRLGIPVVKWDESFTSAEALSILIEADVSRKKRKGIIDKLAASLILQGYLNYLEEFGETQ